MLQLRHEQLQQWCKTKNYNADVRDLSLHYKIYRCNTHPDRPSNYHLNDIRLKL